MPKASYRARLLNEGLRVVHEQGFSGASVRDIVQAAGVPQGSFTNHFTSKEAFGLEIIDLYFIQHREAIDATLRNDALSPLARLRDYIDTNIAHIRLNDVKNGSLLGNFAIEASDRNASLRLRVVAMLAEIEAAISYCLQAAAECGEWKSETSPQALASFIVSSIQGATLLSKAQRNAAPMITFKELLFATVLR